MGRTMKAFVAEGPGRASFRTVDIPELGARDILVKVKYAGICGTDYAIFSGKCSFIEKGQIQYPVRFGHEWSGVVEAAGSGVTRFQTGDRVIGDNLVCCNRCPACQKGDYDNCTDKRCVGTIRCWDGSFAEYIVMPEWHLHHLNPQVGLREAALGEPLSVAYGAVKNMDITENSTVAVIGTGCIGMAAAALAAHKRAKKVIMLGRNPFKLEIALKVGASETINTREEDAETAIMRLTEGKGADFVIECSGVPSTIMQAVKISANHASIGLIGFYECNIDDVDIDLFVSKQLKLFGVMGEFENLRAVNEILHELKISDVITSEIPFEDCLSAFADEKKYHRTNIKTILCFD